MRNGGKRIEKLKIVFLYKGLKWIHSDHYLTCFPFAGIFLTSISSQCCGMASCFGALLSLCLWEHLFQTGFIIYSEFLGLRNSEVTTPLANTNHCTLFLSLLPAGRCSRYFIATLSFLAGLGSEGWGRKGSAWITASWPRGRPQVLH